MPLAGGTILISDFEGDAYAAESANDTTTATSYVNGTLHGLALTALRTSVDRVRWSGRLQRHRDRPARPAQ